jgi:hypothetical protein
MFRPVSSGHVWAEKLAVPAIQSPSLRPHNIGVTSGMSRNYFGNHVPLLSISMLYANNITWLQAVQWPTACIVAGLGLLSQDCCPCISFAQLSLDDQLIDHLVGGESCPH